jgi:hypothetical protein
MRTHRFWLSLLGTLALASLPAAACAQPVGSEFQVNAYTTSYQHDPSVASDANGNFVIVWSSLTQDGSGFGVFGQRYDSAGGTLGSEFRVNSYTTDHQTAPSVASDASGNFVVVWMSYLQDGSGFGIFGQRFDSGGLPQGGEFRVNTYTTRWQSGGRVTSDASGNFVVVWYGNGPGDSPGIFGQRYDSAGVAQGDQFRANSFTTGGQAVPSVASDASGNFVVVWYGNGLDDTPGIFGRRYDSAGGTLGSEFRVNSYTTSTQNFPRVAADASGNVLIGWNSLLQDGSDYGAFGQLYDSEGVAQGKEFQINSFTFDGQQSASLGATGTNQFVVAWESDGQDGDHLGIFGQRYDFSGAETITVVSPNTNVKCVRVSWTDDLSVSDASDVTFQIRPVGLD